VTRRSRLGCPDRRAGDGDRLVVARNKEQTSDRDAGLDDRLRRA
jgi:hypothetical protein